MNAPLTPAERTAASEAIQRRDKRIEVLVKAAMTCTNCGARLKCEWCGHDPHAKPALAAFREAQQGPTGDLNHTTQPE